MKTVRDRSLRRRLPLHGASIASEGSHHYPRRTDAVVGDKFITYSEQIDAVALAASFSHQRVP
jgi:hypothetical protein